jgi:hypothetical protein
MTNDGATGALMRPDLGSFEVGTYYRRNTDGEWVEYIGIATTADAEQVGISASRSPAVVVLASSQQNAPSNPASGLLQLAMH